MAKTSVDSAVLRSSATQVKNIAGNIESEMNSLSRIISTTAAAWEGSSKDSFETTYNTVYKKTLTALQSSLLEYAREMEIFANKSDEFDQQGARMFDIS